MSTVTMSGSTRYRKVLYDDYTGKFYIEDKIDCIERRCGYFQKLAAAKNKSYEKHMEEELKKTKDKHLLEEMKLSREQTMMQKSLQDLQAYSQVLEEISQKNKRHHENSNFGKYGIDNIHKELLPKIAYEKMKMTPRYIRKQNIVKQRIQRKRLSVFDRNIPLENLYNEWNRKKKIVVESKGVISVKEKVMKKANQEIDTGENGEKKDIDDEKRAKLILPPLQVSTRRHKGLGSGSKSEIEDATKDVSKTVEDTESCYSAQAIFVTSTQLPEVHLSPPV